MFAFLKRNEPNTFANLADIAHFTATSAGNGKLNFEITTTGGEVYVITPKNLDYDIWVRNFSYGASQLGSKIETFTTPA